VLLCPCDKQFLQYVFKSINVTQAAYHTALSRTPEADPVLLRALQRRWFKRHTSTALLPRSSMQSDSAMFPVFTPPGEKLNLRR